MTKTQEKALKESIPLLGRLFAKKTTKQKDVDLALNDSDMRDVVLTLVRRSNINFNNIYLKPTQNEIENDPDIETWDGMIMRPEGYFRVAVEPDTGVKIILFEFEPKHLPGIKNNDGSLGFSAVDAVSTPDDLDVYRVAAFDPAVEQSVLEDAINAFCKKLRSEIVPGLDLYLRDETVYSKDIPDKTGQIFRAANQEVAFGITKNEAEQWLPIMYTSMRGTHDESGRFEKIDAIDRKEKTMRKIFRMNIDEMTEHDSAGEALQNTMRHFSLSAHREFKGKRNLINKYSFKSIFRRKGLKNKWDYARSYIRQQLRFGYRGLAGFIGSRYREYGMSAGVGLALGIKGMKLGAARAVLLAIVGAIGSTFFGKFVDEQTQKGVKMFFTSRSEYKEMKGKLPQNRDYSRFFDSRTSENKARPVKKVSRAIVGRLRLLSHKEAGVMNSMDKTYAVNRKDWKQQYLGGLETRMFGKSNIALCGNSVLKIMPNGVLSLTHINEAFNIVSKYYTYREEFVSSKLAPIHPQIRDDLAKGTIKVTDARGESGLQIKVMRRSDFTKEVKKLYADVNNIYGAPTTVPDLLSKLFNPNAKGEVHDHLIDLLGEAAKVSIGTPKDSLEVLMSLSRTLRDERHGNKGNRLSKRRIVKARQALAKLTY